MLHIVERKPDTLVLQDTRWPKRLLKYGFLVLGFVLICDAFGPTQWQALPDKEVRYFVYLALVVFLIMSFGTSNHITFDRTAGAIIHRKSTLWWSYKKVLPLQKRTRATVARIFGDDSFNRGYRPVLEFTDGRKSRPLSDDGASKSSAEELAASINRWLAAATA